MASVVYAYAIFICICIHFALVHSVKQQVTLYDAPQNSSALNASALSFGMGDNTRYVNTALLAANSKLVKPTGACTNGMWMVYSEPNYATNGTFSILSALLPNTTKPPQCVNMSSTPIQSLRHVGHTDISVSALSLYDNPSMAAGRELYFEGYRLVLPSSIAIGSYGFTGASHWRLSPVIIGSADAGADVCLELPMHNDTQLNATQGSIITYKEGKPGFSWSVREIRAGCTGNESSVLYPDYDIFPFELAANGSTPEPWDGMEWWRQAAQTQTNNTSVSASNSTNTTVPTSTSTSTSAPITTPNTPTPAPIPIHTASVDSFMNSSGLKLTLRTKPNSTETGELILIGTKLRLMEPMLLLNYTFIGSPPRNWTIYSDVYGSSGGRCIVYGTVPAMQMQGNATTTTETILVGAIKLGCDGETATAGAQAVSVSTGKFQFTVTLLVVLLAVAILK